MTAHMISTLSTLPSAASALQSSISALERDAAALESQSSGLEPWLGRFTLLVAIGVALEIIVVIHDHRKELKEWRVSELIPEGPSLIKLGIEIASIILVIVGVMGEFGVGLRISSINGQLRAKGADLRSKSDQLLALVTQQAGTAESNAESAAKDASRAKGEADAVKAEAKEITGRLNAAIQRLEMLGPRWQLLEDHKAELIKALTPFPKQKITLFSCGMTGGEGLEADKLRDDLNNFLGDAGWLVGLQDAAWDDCMIATKYSGAEDLKPIDGGLVLLLSPSLNDVVKGSAPKAAEALKDTLNELIITTRKTLGTRVDTEQSIVDAKSLWKRVGGNDDKEIFLLVGPNPHFTLTRRNRRPK